MTGTVLGGRYEILGLISEGGTARVYKAHCRMLDRIVAVKILKDEYSSDLVFVQKFKTEALAAAQLSHPNIVNIYDVGQQNDIYYIVMEYIQGQTLKEIINQEAPLPLEQAITIASMICDGLHHAHEKGVIHRDIKPNNIIVTESGIVKVADFGIAKAISKKTITYGGNIVGSVHYLSPEQARGEPVTRTTDIYSVGCILYEMLTGQVPFDAESPIAVALKHIHDEPTSPRLLNESIPRGVEAIILKAMAKVPSQRFATAQELRNALLSFSVMGAAGGKTGSGRPGLLPFMSRKPGSPGKRRIKKSTLVVAGIALLGLLCGFFFTNHVFFGKEVEVPDLVGLTMKEAQDQLDPLDLKINKLREESSDQYEADKITSQDPAKGQKVKTGRTIDVVVSKGSEMVTVPRVIGDSYNDAERELKGLGFEIGKVTRKPSDDDPENAVISQDPGPHKEAPRGSSVDLVVSQGKTPDKITVPDLLGKSTEQARKLLENSNLSLGTVGSEASSQYDKGKICRQNPAAGSQADENSSVEVYVSSGASSSIVQTKHLRFTVPQDTGTISINVTDSEKNWLISIGARKTGDKVDQAINYTGSLQSVVVKLDGVQFNDFVLQ